MQFDIYANKNKASKAEFPFLLDIQSNTLEKLATRIVVPLTPATKINKPTTILQPLVTVNKKQYIALFDEMASYPSSELLVRVGNLVDNRTLFLNALDLIIQGY